MPAGSQEIRKKQQVPSTGTRYFCHPCVSITESASLHQFHEESQPFRNLAAQRTKPDIPFVRLMTDAIFQCLCGCEKPLSQKLAPGSLSITQCSVICLPRKQTALAHGSLAFPVHIPPHPLKESFIMRVPIGRSRTRTCCAFTCRKPQCCTR